MQKEDKIQKDNLLKEHEVKEQIALLYGPLGAEEHQQIYVAYERLLNSEKERERVKKIKSPTYHGEFWDWAAYKILKNYI